MMGRITTPVTVALVVALGAWIAASQGCASTLPSAPVATSPPVAPVVEVAFETTDIDGEDPDEPHNQVVLLWGPPGAEGAREVVDTVPGVCTVVPQEDVAVLPTLDCWWAGQGYVYSLRRSGDTLLVERHYESEEESEGDEDPGEVLHRITLEPGTRVSPKTR